MENKKPVSFEKHAATTLYKALSLVKHGAFLILTSILLFVIYINFEVSITKSFESYPKISDHRLTTSNIVELDPDRVENGIHVETGMIYDHNFDLVRRSCTSCHSSKLVIQNRATRDGWAQMIDWMQETQGLQDLGKYEVKILDYLEKNYSPKEIGRRKNLKIDDEDWYVIDLTRDIQ